MGFNQTLLIKSGGATAFTGLTDTFPNYTGRANQALVVNNAGTGITTQNFPTGGSDQLSDGVPVGRPALSALTWRNQGPATANEYSNGPIIVTSPTANGDNLRCLEQAVPGTTPYTITAKLTPLFWNINYISGGVHLVDSTGKLLVIQIVAGGGTLQMERWNSVSSLNSAPGNTLISTKQSIWLRITNDGTNLNGYVSNDGVEWILYYTEASNAFLGTITNAGIFIDCNNTGSYISKLSIWSFMLEAGTGTNSHW